MDRAYRLSFCKRCINRSFSPKGGVICSLTSDVATFDQSCKDFSVDEKMELSMKRQEADVIGEEVHSDSLGLSIIGIKNGIIAGIIVIIGAIVWLGIGLSYQRLFFYPIILFLIGVIALIKGIVKQQKSIAAKKVAETVIDDEIL
ncbi:MAG: hypothetical protein WED10_03300 [Brumimicrobium sp.]